VARELDLDLEVAREALKNKPSDLDPATWESAWCLKQPNIGTVIPGIELLLQLEKNARAGGIAL
jgi:aryl-alcohol dehydrogenase-like predicted oxidoreductase